MSGRLAASESKRRPRQIYAVEACRMSEQGLGVSRTLGRLITPVHTHLGPNGQEVNPRARKHAAPSGGRIINSTHVQRAGLGRTSALPYVGPENMNLLDAIGDTDLVELSTGVPNPNVRLFGKLEGNNPAGSVKDRPARAMILGAEARGDLHAGMRLIEPTSGNTGIALAMVAAARGYSIELVMPENATAERVQIMRAYGAEVTLTAEADGMEGAIDYARRKVDGGGYFMLDQFSNPDNPRAHYETTGPEIWRDTEGAITHFVSAMGTTGTIMGVSRYLKEQNAAVEIVGVQPADGAKIPGIRRWPEAYLPKIFEHERVDRIVDVTQAAAEAMCRQLAREEGVFVGVSAAGAVLVSRQLAATLKRGTLVCILCDRADRYLSSSLFGFAAQSDGEQRDV